MPIREIGVAGLIANQASLSVSRALGAWMAEAARDLRADIVFGLPTLGHVFAPLVAEALGHPNWAAAGYSRKLWYDPALSASIRSITSEAERRIWLDPRLLPRLRGRRILLVDDVISSGTSALAGLALLATTGLRPVGLAVAMIQTRRWAALWPPDLPVRAACETPSLRRTGAGWEPLA